MRNNPSFISVSSLCVIYNLPLWFKHEFYLGTESFNFIYTCVCSGSSSGSDDYSRGSKINDSHVWEPIRSPETQSLELYFIHHWFIWHNVVRKPWTTLLRKCGCQGESFYLNHHGELKFKTPLLKYVLLVKSIGLWPIMKWS